MIHEDIADFAAALPPLGAIAGLDLGRCRRVFYNQEDFLELHLNILRGVNRRYKTPFFTALKEYSKQPTGVFHAMPISRGKSISRSHWIQDMGAFYGPNIFLAETSATSGGLDSLLEPHGPAATPQRVPEVGMVEVVSPTRARILMPLPMLESDLNILLLTR